MGESAGVGAYSLSEGGWNWASYTGSGTFTSEHREDTHTLTWFEGGREQATANSGSSYEEWGVYGPGGAIGGYLASDSYSEGGSWDTLSKTTSSSHTPFGEEQSGSQRTISGSYSESSSATDDGDFDSEGDKGPMSETGTFTGGTDSTSDRSFTAQAVYNGSISRIEAHSNSHDTASFSAGSSGGTDYSPNDSSSSSSVSWDEDRTSDGDSDTTKTYAGTSEVVTSTWHNTLDDTGSSTLIEQPNYGSSSYSDEPNYTDSCSYSSTSDTTGTVSLYSYSNPSSYSNEWGTASEPSSTTPYAGPDQSAVDGLVQDLSETAAGAYTGVQPVAAAVDAAIEAFTQVDADAQGNGGGAAYMQVRAPVGGGEGTQQESTNTATRLGDFWGWLFSSNPIGQQGNWNRSRQTSVINNLAKDPLHGEVNIRKYQTAGEGGKALAEQVQELPGKIVETGVVGAEVGLTAYGGGQAVRGVYALGRIGISAARCAATQAPRLVKQTFPNTPGNLLSNIPRNAKGHIQPSEYLRIRPEQHAIKPGETFSPRHHGQHYHVEIRIDPSKSWNNAKNVKKVKPPGYLPGEGTGFLPGEPFP